MEENELSKEQIESIKERYATKEQLIKDLIDMRHRLLEMERLQRTHEDLLSTKAVFEGLFEFAPEAILVVNRQGRIERINRQAERILGYSRESCMDRPHEIMIPDRFREAHRKHMADFIAAPKVRPMGKELNLYLKRQDGSEFPVDIALGPMETKEDFVVLAVVRDITESRRKEQMIIEREVRYRTLFEHSPVPVWEEDFSEVKAFFDHLRAIGILNFREYFKDHPDEVVRCKSLIKVLDMSRETLEFFKAENKEEILSNMPVLFGAAALDAMREELIALAEGKHRFESELPARTLTGEQKTLVLRLSVSPGFEEQLSRVLVSFIDISGRKRMEETIIHQAYHDPLTGLPNRMLFMDHLSHELVEARRFGKRLAVFFLDLDHFKNINDTLGHAVGDELLKQVSGRLKAALRQTDIISRIGGDEFNLLLPDITRSEVAAVIARDLESAFEKPFIINDLELRVTASIGISLYPEDGESADNLLKNADIAMYSAKDLGRNNFQFYSPAMNVRTLERIMLETNLRKAIERGELAVYYQPIVDIATRRIVCAEALVRWHHPEHGLLFPGDFMPIAEETGVIAAIDEWVLRSVCFRNRSWQDARYPPICITVNLSARQFDKPDLVETISRILEETGLDSRYLEIEITENIAMRNIELTIAKMTRLAGMGIRFSIDDFGTGYSSLSHLKRLPIRRLKIDRSFIRGLNGSTDNRAIVEAVIAMGHHLQISVVAEGVETEDQLSFLRSSSCDEMQGFLFSEPLPEQRFEDLVL